MDGRGDARAVRALETALEHSDDPVAAVREFYALYFQGFFVDPAQADGARVRVGDDPPEALANHLRVNALSQASLGDYDWGARLLVMERCGHFPWMERSAVFFAAIDDFLGR